MSPFGFVDLSFISMAVGKRVVADHHLTQGQNRVGANMRPPIWLLVVASPGNIGFMAMLARMLWLRESAGFRK
jgi:hypothetical protein